MRRTLIRFQIMAICTIFGGIGCSETPSAPEEYEAMLGFVFAHMDDEEPQALVDGLETLFEWLQEDANLSQAMGGYRIDRLESTVVNGLDDVERGAGGLQGVSVVTKSAYGAQEIARTETWDGFGEVIEENFDVYEREFEMDSVCFGTRTCDWITAESNSRSSWAGLVDMETQYTIQFRWVETAHGPMMLHRTWLRAPAGDGKVTMNGNYILKINFDYAGRDVANVPPAFRNVAGGLLGGASQALTSQQDNQSKPGALRVMANWFDISGSLPLPDQLLFNILVENTKTDAARLDEWIDENGLPN